MLSKFNGYKTYFVSAAVVIYALTGYFTGNLDANAAFMVIANGLGLATLRHGISNSASA